MRNAATILAIHTRPTGEPCAVKAASTVREGAVGKGLVNSTSLAAYFADSRLFGVRRPLPREPAAERRVRRRG